MKNMLPANVDMRLAGLTLIEAGPNGRTLVIEAPAAQYNQAGDTFTLTGQADRKVKAAESGGGVLLSERLILNFKDGHLASESPFCYAAPETELAGSAFVYHTRDRRLMVEGPADLLF
jgi:hypothetical protein